MKKGVEKNGVFTVENQGRKTMVVKHGPFNYSLYAIGDHERNCITTAEDLDSVKYIFVD
jgi:hypothetical protein